jgi:hypothetical protein
MKYITRALVVFILALAYIYLIHVLAQWMMETILEHWTPTKGLSDKQSPLIKTANTCGNCIRSYGKVFKGVTMPFSDTRNCNLHNCAVASTQWCKHHKRPRQ